MTRAATPIPRPSSRQPPAQPSSPLPPPGARGPPATGPVAPPTAGTPGAAAATGTGPKSTALPGPSVQVAVCVPGCVLQFGEHLKLVGSIPELGMWEAAESAQLQWQEGDNWVATLSLPPGEHACKLVLVRLDGSLHWEEGEDRLLGVPAGASLVMASFQFGNTALSEVLAKQPKSRPFRAPPTTFAGRAMPGAPAAPAPAAGKPMAMSAAAALRAAEEKLALARR